MPKFGRLSRSASQTIGTIVAFLCLIVIAGAAFYILHSRVMNDGAAHKQAKLILDATSTGKFDMEVVSSPAEQAKGLSGRSGLTKNTGMLFVNTADDRRCFWMKDMRFNIDIVWLNHDKRVTSIVPNLSPATYPQQYCATAQYVAELPPGTAGEHSLRPGQIVRLHL